MRAVMYHLRKVVGAYRHAWGFCPACNSDAPRLYTCSVCKDGRYEFPPSPATKRVRWQRFCFALMVATIATACQSPTPVDRPCGVIRDSLLTVQATTPAGQQRLDVHYERGKSARCW